MKTQANFVERRERPRGGVMTQLEDITYSVLRKHGVVSAHGRDTASTSADPPINGKEKTMASLRVIVRNDQPIREEEYPLTWLLYKDTNTIEIHVRHDTHNHPFVLDKGVA